MVVVGGCIGPGWLAWSTTRRSGGEFWGPRTQRQDPPAWTLERIDQLHTTAHTSHRDGRDEADGCYPAAFCKRCHLLGTAKPVCMRGEPWMNPAGRLYSSSAVTQQRGPSSWVVFRLGKSLTPPPPLAGCQLRTVEARSLETMPCLLSRWAHTTQVLHSRHTGGDAPCILRTETQAHSPPAPSGHGWDGAAAAAAAATKQTQTLHEQQLVKEPLCWAKRHFISGPSWLSTLCRNKEPRLSRLGSSNLARDDKKMRDYCTVQHTCSVVRSIFLAGR